MKSSLKTSSHELPAFTRMLPHIERRTGKLIQQRIERDYELLQGPYGCMRGFQTMPCAQVVRAGHGFIRNLRDSFYRLGVPIGDPYIGKRHASSKRGMTSLGS